MHQLDVKPQPSCLAIRTATGRLSIGKSAVPRLDLCPDNPPLPKAFHSSGRFLWLLFLCHTAPTHKKNTLKPEFTQLCNEQHDRTTQSSRPWSLSIWALTSGFMSSNSSSGGEEISNYLMGTEFPFRKMKKLEK